MHGVLIHCWFYINKRSHTRIHKQPPGQLSKTHTPTVCFREKGCLGADLCGWPFIVVVPGWFPLRVAYILCIHKAVLTSSFHQQEPLQFPSNPICCGESTATCKDTHTSTHTCIQANKHVYEKTPTNPPGVGSCARSYELNS